MTRRKPKPKPPKAPAEVAAVPTLGPQARILGLDVSSSCVGWACFVGREPVAYGKFVPAGDNHSERLADYQDKLLELLQDLNPDYLVAETPFQGAKRFSFAVLQLFQAITLVTHYRWFGVEMPELCRVRAHDVKRLNDMPKGTSYAGRKKAMVLEMNRLYGLSLKYKDNDKSKSVSDDDIADALAVVTAFLNRMEHI